MKYPVGTRVKYIGEEPLKMLMQGLVITEFMNGYGYEVTELNSMFIDTNAEHFEALGPQKGMILAGKAKVTASISVNKGVGLVR